MRPECYFGIEAEVFSEAGDLAWDVEGFLLIIFRRDGV